MRGTHLKYSEAADEYFTKTVEFRSEEFAVLISNCIEESKRLE